MRKVTEYIVHALIAGERGTKGNSTTDGQTLFLHGNPIARAFKDEQGREGFDLSLCGWNTPTTRERLNGLLCAMGYGIHANTRGNPYVGVWMRNGQPFIGQHGAGFQEWKTTMPPDAFVRVYCPRDAKQRATANVPGWFGGTESDRAMERLAEQDAQRAQGA